MIEHGQFLIRHGIPVLFLAVFLEQIGVPLPAAPWLLVAGALSATHQFNPLVAVIVTIIGCLPADGIWFYLGRRRGNQVLHLLCRISLEPDTCVRKTQNIFFKQGTRGVILSKFLPGFGTLIPPLAGMSGVGASRFFFLDAIASLLYGVVFVALGFAFSTQIDRITAALSQIGGRAIIVLVGLVAVYIGLKLVRRQWVLKKLRMARISVQELRKKQTAGEDLFILDLRSAVEIEQDPAVIEGAVHFDVEAVEIWFKDIPLDRDIILYCSCPNEVTSARIALLLHKKGITRVRPLLGGIDEWRKFNHPVTKLAY